MKNRREKASTKIFATLLLTFVVTMLALSGICLYVAPQCSVAEEITWRILGLEKGQWESIHMTSALVFLVLASIHLLRYNWKVFVAYLKPGATRILLLRPELFFSLLAAVILLIGAALIIPPFSILPDANDAIQMHYREKSGIDDNSDGLHEGRGRGRKFDKFENSATSSIVNQNKKSFDILKNFCISLPKDNSRLSQVHRWERHQILDRKRLFCL